MNWLAVGMGATLGAWLRWNLARWMNGWSASLPYGTLAANLTGGFFAGVALAYFDRHPALSPAWRLFCVTGFLGGLTTFSTFSAESLMLLSRGEYGWAVAHSLVHLLGSVACCVAGFAVCRALTT